MTGRKRYTKGPLILRKGYLRDGLLAEAEDADEVHGNFVAALAANRERLKSILADFHFTAEEMEDVLQDVFVVVLKDLHAIRDFKAFLVALTYRKCIQLKRRFKRNREIPGLQEFWKELGETLVADENPDWALDIQRLLKGLPWSERNVLKMRLFGFDNQEIASSLGLSPESIRSIFGRGVRRLQGLLKIHPGRSIGG